MTTMTAFEAKTHFGEVLVRVSRGEEIVITRYDKPMARIVPEGGHDTRKTMAAVDGLLALQKRIGSRSDESTALSDAEARSAIDEGRR